MCRVDEIVHVPTVKLMVSLMYVLTWWDLVPTSPWGNLHPVATAMLIVTMISIRKHSVLKTVSIGNRFWWLYINRFQSPWFWCIIIWDFLMIRVKRGRGFHVSKEGRGYQEGGWKKREGGADTPSHTMNK